MSSLLCAPSCRTFPNGNFSGRKLGVDRKHLGAFIEKSASSAPWKTNGDRSVTTGSKLLPSSLHLTRAVSVLGGLGAAVVGIVQHT